MKYCLLIIFKILVQKGGKTMKILTSKTRERSMIAQTLRQKGSFRKEKGKYVQGDLEIWFLEETAINQSHVDWADVICGSFYNTRVRSLVFATDKFVDQSPLRLVQYEIFGAVELWQVVTYFDNTPSKINFNIRQTKVLEYQVDEALKNKQCFYTEKEAAEFAHTRIKQEVEKCKEALKYLEKLEKDWQRTLNSF